MSGLEIMEGLGSSEVLHIYLSNTAEAKKLGAAGKRVPGYEIRLEDSQGRAVADGEEGILWVRGDSNAPVYWNRPDKTAETMREGGWIYTGDRFVRDADGFHFFRGRADDLVKVSGQWVYPLEVELALADHPSVRECAVAAIEGADRLTVLKAFVVLNAGASAAEQTTKELQDYVKARLLPYKYPRIVAYLDELPKTGSGKIDRQALLKQDAPARFGEVTPRDATRNASAPRSKGEQGRGRSWWGWRCASADTPTRRPAAWPGGLRATGGRPNRGRIALPRWERGDRLTDLPKPPTRSARCRRAWLRLGSTWICTWAPCTASFSAASMRSQMACDAATVILPGTTRWNSMNVTRPAVRVLTSCAWIAPSALVEMTWRMWRATSAVTASSISPLTDSLTSFQPAQRMLAATSAASAGSSTCQPVRATSANPTSTPTEVATSVNRCQPSATSAGDRWRRPQVIRKYDQPALMAVATPLMRMPCTGCTERAGRSRAS